MFIPAPPHQAPNPNNYERTLLSAAPQTIAPNPHTEVKVTVRLTVSQSVCLGVGHPCGTCDQILLAV
jgi:hypothetical protein